MPTPLLRSSRRALAALFPLVLIAPLFAALDAPVSPNAQAGVWRTMHLLNRIEGKYILSGQQEMPAWDDTTTKSWDDDFAYIKAKTKKVPAVRGFDFLFYTHSAGGRTGQRSTERAIEWSKKGGVVAFAAHMFMLNGTNDGTNPHFYVPSANNGKGTLIDVRKVVVDGTPENKEFIEKLDLVAAELKKLQKANVPVIWRPFHESGGTWFWWSANGPEGFKAAWRFMFERYTKVHKLTNLIWCFNPADTAKLDAWYPGDDVVDMISLDVYPTAGTHPTFAEDYKKMRAYKDGRKVIAMSECGAIPDPAKMFTEGAGWSYFCTWNGFESDLTRHTVDFLKKVYTHKKVITLDELPAIRKANSLVIIDHPQPQIVVSGKKLSLSVKASGTGTLKYQWYRDGKKNLRRHESDLHDLESQEVARRHLQGRRPHLEAEAHEQKRIRRRHLLHRGTPFARQRARHSRQRRKETSRRFRDRRQQDQEKVPPARTRTGARRRRRDRRSARPQAHAQRPGQSDERQLGQQLVHLCFDLQEDVQIRGGHHARQRQQGRRPPPQPQERPLQSPSHARELRQRPRPSRDLRSRAHQGSTSHALHRARLGRKEPTAHRFLHRLGQSSHDSHPRPRRFACVRRFADAR
ncbi:MAG: glycosyl hydrolase [Opitutus sp.]|nr:glycosyl hydrolase [Opitutus sp.]